MCTFRLIFDCSLCTRRFTDFTGLSSETSNRALVQAVGCQVFLENALGDSIKGFAEAQ